MDTTPRSPRPRRPRAPSQVLHRAHEERVLRAPRYPLVRLVRDDPARGGHDGQVRRATGAPEAGGAEREDERLCR